MMQCLVGNSRSSTCPARRFPETFGPQTACEVITFRAVCAVLLRRHHMMKPLCKPFEGRDGGMSLLEEIVAQHHAGAEGILYHGVLVVPKLGLSHIPPCLLRQSGQSQMRPSR